MMRVLWAGSVALRLATGGTAAAADLSFQAEAQTLSAPVAGALSLSGDDQERVADCAGRDATITGRRSAYILRGSCRSLTVQGDLLTVQAEVQPGARIAVTGRGSVVSWSVHGHGSAPVAVVRGPGSRLQRAQPPGQ